MIEIILNFYRESLLMAVPLTFGLVFGLCVLLIKPSKTK